MQRLNSKCLQRFLRAFLTPEDSFDALLRYIEWRDKFQIDSINGDHSDVVKEHAAGRCYVVNDRDRDGRYYILEDTFEWSLMGRPISCLSNHF